MNEVTALIILFLFFAIAVYISYTNEKNEKQREIYLSSEEIKSEDKLIKLLSDIEKHQRETKTYISVITFILIILLIALIVIAYIFYPYIKSFYEMEEVYKEIYKGITSLF